MGRILYLGLNVPKELHHKEVDPQDIIHYPMIKILPRPHAEMRGVFEQFENFTHLIFTSKSAVAIFMECVGMFSILLKEIQKKTIIVVGKKTAAKLTEYGVEPSVIATEETAEGVVKVLDQIFKDDKNGLYVFWPHSSKARSLIFDWLKSNEIKNLCLPVYDTLTDFKEPKPELKLVDEIVFTSPSTIDAFLVGYGAIPEDKILTCIGPVTKGYLERFQRTATPKKIEGGSFA